MGYGNRVKRAPKTDVGEIAALVTLGSNRTFVAFYMTDCFDRGPP
jgi:hypothetical protein